MEKNNQKVLTIVTIITVTLLIILFAGVTYAFFTANNPEGSTAQIISENGRMLITYNDGTDNIVPVTNIQPSNAILVNKTFTLIGSNTTVGMKTDDGLEMPYKVGVQYTSTFSDGMMHYYIKEVNRPANSNVTANYVITSEPGKTENDYKNQTVPGNDTYTGYTHGTFKNGSKYTEMVTGVFPALKTDQTITFNLIIQFPDNNENQDSEKGKTFNGKIVINQNQYLNDYIADLDKTDNGLEIDDTVDKNLRYVGASPNNYIKFNDETWRLIGIFNVYNVETNNYENLVKIVRNDSLGDYSLDTSDSLINFGKGINEWSQADLMYELNCDGNLLSGYCRDEDILNGYLSNIKGNTIWYNGRNNAKNGSYDYNNNIKNLFINKIANVRWGLGGNLSHTSSVQQYYENEKGTVHVSDPTDGITRKDYWDGMIALLYASDYGYASTNIACRKSLSSNVSGIFNCSNDNWLFNNVNEWLLSSRYGDSDNFFKIDYNGGVSYYYVSDSFAIRPALFLKSTVTISGGKGTIDNPYTIG